MSAMKVPALPSVRSLAAMGYDAMSQLFTDRIQAIKAIVAAELASAVPVPVRKLGQPIACSHYVSGQYKFQPLQERQETWVPRPHSTQGKYKVPAPAAADDGMECSYCADARAETMRIIRTHDLTVSLEAIEASVRRALTFTEVQYLVRVASHYGSTFGSAIVDRASVYHDTDGGSQADATERVIADIMAQYRNSICGNGRATSEDFRITTVRSENNSAECAVDELRNARRASGRDREARVRNMLARMNSYTTDIARNAASKPPSEIAPSASELRATHRARCVCEFDEDGDRVTEFDDCAYCSGNDAGNTGLKTSPDHGKPFLATKADKVRRLVGVEVEFNNRTNITRWVTKWRGSIHSDGSCGWEAVTTPMGGQHVTQCMLDLCRDLRANNTQADERCGIHVHVDANDVSWHDMRRVIKVYSKVEPLLYLIAGQQRLTQQYCVPNGDALGKAAAGENWKDAILSTVLGTGAEVAKKRMKDRVSKKDGGRYRGMNLMPWLAGRRVKAFDTTIEFRMHRNSLDGTRIANWAHLCAALVDYAVKATDAEVDALPKSALRALCDHIAPNLRRWVLRRVLAWRSVTTAERTNRSSITGERMAKRRISFKKGTVSSCAV